MVLDRFLNFRALTNPLRQAIARQGNALPLTKRRPRFALVLIEG
jgi:hypothetical protein